MFHGVYYLYHEFFKCIFLFYNFAVKVLIQMNTV